MTKQKPKERKLKIKNFNYQYYDFGRDKNTLLFLHPTGMNKDNFLQDLKLHFKDCRIVIPDLPGHNGLSLQNIKTINDYADYIYLLTKELKLKNIFLFGFSLGGIIAMETAKLNANKIEGVISWAAPIRGKKSITAKAKLLIAICSVVPSFTYNVVTNEKAMLKLSSVFQTPLSDNEIKSLAKTKRSEMIVILNAIKSYRFSPITVPALFIKGDYDPLIKNTLDRRDKNITSLVIPGAGHFGTKDGYNKAYKEIIRFVEK